MAKKKHNFEIVIRGVMSAYDKDEIIDQFVKKSACFNFMEHAMGFSADYDASIKVSDLDGASKIGYYDVNQYTDLVNRLAKRISANYLTAQLFEIGERIKVYNLAIDALRNAKIGLFGNKEQVSKTYDELCKNRDEGKTRYAELKEQLDNMDNPFRRSRFPDEQSIASARWILQNLDCVYMIREPKDTDTVGTTTGTVK
jgi:hypothetical protein